MQKINSNTLDLVRYGLGVAAVLAVVFFLAWHRQRRALSLLKEQFRHWHGGRVFVRIRSWHKGGSDTERTYQLRASIEVGIPLTADTGDLFVVASRTGSAQQRAFSCFRTIASAMGAQSLGNESVVGPFTLVPRGDSQVAAAFQSMPDDLKKSLEALFELGFRQVKLSSGRISLCAFHDELKDGHPEKVLRQIPYVLGEIGAHLSKRP